MSMPENQCPHSDMHFNVHHQAFHDSNLHYLEITGKCRICGKAAEFRGMPIGLSPAQPTMGADGLEIRIPWFGEDEEPRGPMISALVGQVAP
jgi:hypothetical protein